MRLTERFRRSKVLVKYDSKYCQYYDWLLGIKIAGHLRLFWNMDKLQWQIKISPVLHRQALDPKAVYSKQEYDRLMTCTDFIIGNEQQFLKSMPRLDFYVNEQDYRNKEHVLRS